ARALSARQRTVGPEAPAPDALMRLECGVGAAYCVPHICIASRDDDGVHALAACIARTDADDRRFPDAALRIERLLDVVGEDVEAFSRDDHLLLASADGEPSLAVDRSDVARVEPAIPQRRLCLALGRVVAGRDVVAAHQHLAIVGNAHLDAADSGADRAGAALLQRMRQRDDGCCFGEAVALDDEIAKLAPEPFEFGIERRPADDDGPELPAELAPHVPIAPPAPDEILPG